MAFQWLSFSHSILFYQFLRQIFHPIFSCKFFYRIFHAKFPTEFSVELSVQLSVKRPVKIVQTNFRSKIFSQIFQEIFSGARGASDFFFGARGASDARTVRGGYWGRHLAATNTVIINLFPLIFFYTYFICYKCNKYVIWESLNGPTGPIFF